jgi:hypothetical protein
VEIHAWELLLLYEFTKIVFICIEWIENKEMDILDIATIRDTRTGRYAKIPKDPKSKSLRLLQ